MPDVDLSEFAQYENRRGIRKCRIGGALEQLTDEAGAVLNAALAAPERVSNAAVHRWCKARDLDTTIAAVIAHRKGDCSCGR